MTLVPSSLNTPPTQLGRDCSRVHERPRLPEVDGLRGISVLAVIFLHYFVQGFPQAFSAISPDFVAFCMGSDAAVDLFFVV